jgi:hypothetical protein
MSKASKVLLGISLTGFVFGATGVYYGFGTPVGAIFFGLFLISKVTEKETALFDEEERRRYAGAPAHGAKKAGSAEPARGIGAARLGSAHSH